jgi:hypothetical protein
MATASTSVNAIRESAPGDFLPFLAGDLSGGYWPIPVVHKCNVRSFQKLVNSSGLGGFAAR